MLEASINQGEGSLDAFIDRENIKVSHLQSPAGIKATNIRWLVLALACFTCLGEYFCVDLPQALQTAMMDKLGLEVMDFNAIYSFYSFPNTVLPFFGGLIIDYLGIKTAYLVFALFVILGQVVGTFGVYQLNMTIILVGRVIFAIGGDSIIVAKSAMIAKWFMGKELSFALGTGLCIGRLGSSLNSFVSPKLYDWKEQLYIPYVFGLILSILSGIAVFGLNHLDKKADQQEEQVKAKPQDKSGNKVTLQDLKSFKLIYYLLVISSIFLYGGLYGLTNNVNDLMVKRFGFTPSSAGNVIPIIYICPVIITPFFGTFADKKGKRALITLIVSVIFSLDHLAIAYLPDTETPSYSIAWCLLVVGLFYATYAAVFWPCIAIVVGQKLMGVGYGIAFSAENLMLALLPLGLGKIHDNTLDKNAGYFWTQITLSIIVAAAVVLNVWIYINDKMNGGKLDKPGTEEETQTLKSKAALSFMSI